MIGNSGSNMGSVGAVLLMLISDAGASILNDFPRAAQQFAVESGGPALRLTPTLRKKGNIYKNFISRQLAFSGWIGSQVPSESIFIVRNSMDVIYLLILVALYCATYALVWAFERLGRTP